MSKTAKAFDSFRARFPEKPCDMTRVQNREELRLLSAAEGVQSWIDGPGQVAPASTPPTVADVDTRLWVVRSDAVVHASERPPIAETLESRVIKHSNLTGGLHAHCGGELIFVDGNTVVLNGSSGRYGPNSEVEMTAVAKAFRESGYGVWSYGWDASIDRPFAFRDTRIPEWVK